MVPQHDKDDIAPGLVALGSNRSGQGAVSVEPVKVGTDTITLAGEVAEGHRLTKWSEHIVVDPATGEEHRHTSGGVVTLPCGAQMQVRRRGSALRAEVTQSIPNLARQHNAVASTLDEVRHYAEVMHREGSDFYDFLVPVEDLEVLRWDGVRDFHSVPMVPTFLTNLGRLPSPRAGMSSTYRDTRDGSVQTVKRGTRGRWTASLYDKYAQVIHLAAKAKDPSRREVLHGLAPHTVGQVRYEVVIRRPVLQENGVNTLSDITSAAAEALTRKHFNMAGFDVPAHAAGHLNAVVLAKSLTEDSKSIGGVLAYLAGAALGTGWKGDPRVGRKYRDLAETWGVTPGDWMNEHGGLAALDFDLGALA